MAEYIDREAAFAVIADNNRPAQMTLACYDNLLDGVGALPAADVVEVVRCIDCVHLGFKDFSGICDGGPMCGIVHPDDYCSHGKRKEEKT